MSVRCKLMATQTMMTKIAVMARAATCSSMSSNNSITGTMAP